MKVLFFSTIALLLLTGCGDGRVPVVSGDYYNTIIEPPPGFFISRTIDPCGDGPGPDEILVELNDGSLMAWYNNIGLVIIEDGNYVTTDSQQCPFSIINGEVVL